MCTFFTSGDDGDDDDDDGSCVLIHNVWTPSARTNWITILNSLENALNEMLFDGEVVVPESVRRRLPKEPPRSMPVGYDGENPLESSMFLTYREKAISSGVYGQLDREGTGKIFYSCPMWCSELYKANRQERDGTQRLDADLDVEEIITIEFMDWWLLLRVKYRNQLILAIMKIDYHFKQMLGL